MNKDLQILYRIKDGGKINADECAIINKALAAAKIGEIPNDQLENVIDYLASSLNMGSVDPSLIKDLEKLLEILQKRS